MDALKYLFLIVFFKSVVAAPACAAGTFDPFAFFAEAEIYTV